MIRAGEDWGELVDPPSTITSVGDDAELAAHLAQPAGGPVRVTGGDLFRTLGGAERSGRLRRYPVDLLWVRIDDAAPVPAVAHVVVRAPRPWGWWTGPLWAVCNVSRVGRWDVAPRAHPNDGRLDVVEVAATMPRRARLQAARRLPTGSHVPHPDIRVRRSTEATISPERPVLVVVDGRRRGVATRVEVTLTPDAGHVHA